jgi:hypothetical protein
MADQHHWGQANLGDGSILSPRSTRDAYSLDATSALRTGESVLERLRAGKKKAHSAAGLLSAYAMSNARRYFKSQELFVARFGSDITLPPRSRANASVVPLWWRRRTFHQGGCHRR